jgi:Fur family transcriptional regulator, ferric uptake regulator
LSIRDIRNTGQKTAIREAFAEADRPLSPEEVLQSAQQRHPGVGITTVYRNIQTLVEEGWLQPVEVPGDATCSELAGKKHHHHFQCNECGKLYDLEGCAAQSKPKLPRGFAHPVTNFSSTAPVRRVSSSSGNAAPCNRTAAGISSFPTIRSSWKKCAMWSASI